MVGPHAPHCRVHSLGGLHGDFQGQAACTGSQRQEVEGQEEVPGRLERADDAGPRRARRERV